jgi:hypothetical protein
VVEIAARCFYVSPRSSDFLVLNLCCTDFKCLECAVILDVLNGHSFFAQNVVVAVHIL